MTYVDSFILQFEVENAALRETKEQQEAKIEELKKQVQGKTRSLFDEICNDQKKICTIILFTHVFAAFEKKCGSGAGGPSRPGQAQRLSSLTFGCFQVTGKNPQVLTGPAPSQRMLTTKGETEGRDKTGNSSYT